MSLRRVLRRASAIALFLLLAPAFAQTSGGDGAERLLRRMVDFYASKKAMACDVSATLLGDGFAGGALTGEFKFAFRRPDHFARIAAPDSRIKASATYADGRFVEHSVEGVYMRGCYPDYATFLERDMAGYWLCMNQFADPNPLRSWMPEGSSASVVGEEKIGGIDCVNVAIAGPERLVSLWIAAAGDPIVHQARHGQPDDEQPSTTRYANWRFDADVPADATVFRPAPGMKRVQIPGEYALVDEGPHQLLGQGDPVARTMRENGQADEIPGKGKVLLQPYWLFEEATTDEQREALIDYLGKLQALENKYRERGVEIFGVLVGSQEDGGRFLGRIKSMGWTFQFTLDDQNYHAHQARLAGFPTLLVIGRDGRVESVYTGMTDCVDELVEEDILLLLQGKQVYVEEDSPKGVEAEIDQP